MRTISKASDGTVWDVGDVVMVDTDITVNRMGVFRVYQALVDGVYFDYIELEVGFNQDVLLQNATKESRVEVVRIKPLPRQLRQADPLPEIDPSDGLDPYEQMFRTFALRYGVADEKSLEKHRKAYEEQLAKEEENADEDD